MSGKLTVLLLHSQFPSKKNSGTMGVGLLRWHCQLISALADEDFWGLQMFTERSIHFNLCTVYHTNLHYTVWQCACFVKCSLRTAMQCGCKSIISVGKWSGDNDFMTLYDLNDCDTVSAVIMQRISEHEFIISIYNESYTVDETAEFGYEQLRGV